MKTFIRVGVTCALACGSLMAIPITYPGCSALDSSDFRMTQLFNKKGGKNFDNSSIAIDPTLSEPTRMDLQVVKDADSNYLYTNVYFTERYGNVKMYDGFAKKVKQIGKIAIGVTSGGIDDNGLMGLVLSPDFSKSRLIYLWYCPKAKVNGHFMYKLSRVVLSSNDSLDMSTEKTLLQFPGTKNVETHTGGAMVFDSYGDLWFAMGNNSADLSPTSATKGGTCNVMFEGSADSSNSAEWGPSNTHSYRGGFMRIHPDNSAKGYSIPAGNFGDYWATKWEKENLDTTHIRMAKEYRDTTKVYPEIYVKGERSNYSIAVHPTKRWLAWGTVNWQSLHDEFNITDHPMFSGFPYFDGYNRPTCASPRRPETIEMPINDSKLNTDGVHELPPAEPAAFSDSLINVAMGGPIYVYDRNLKSPDKFPPHFNEKWIGLSYKFSSVFFLDLDPNTLKLNATNPAIRMDKDVFKNIPLSHPLGAKFGSDGALYILNYDAPQYGTSVNPSLMRITYKGTCVPTAIGKRMQPSDFHITLSANALVVHESGSHEFTLHDLSGHLILTRKGEAGAEYRFPALVSQYKLQKGIYVVRVKTAQGVFAGNISLL